MHGPLFCAPDQRGEVVALNTLQLYPAVLSLHFAMCPQHGAVLVSLQPPNFVTTKGL